MPDEEKDMNAVPAKELTGDLFDVCCLMQAVDRPAVWLEILASQACETRHPRSSAVQ